MHELSRLLSLTPERRKPARYEAVFPEGSDKQNFTITKQGRWWCWSPPNGNGLAQSSHLGNVKAQVEAWGGKVHKIKVN
jgi:hypothetical protein